MSAPGYDIIAAEVHRKAIENVTNEMAISLVRTSGSPVVVDGKDFSTCLLDTTPEHLGFAAYVLLHLGTSLLGTRVISDLAHQLGDLRPGDGWIVNDPHSGGAAHQGDVAVIMPMFHADDHLGWGFVNMHILDVGGSGLGGIAPTARDVYSEGLRFPAVRAIRDGRLEREWELFIAANVRAPGPVLNDIRSMIAANNVGNQKLGAVVERFGRPDYERFCAINKDITERLFRERISRIPDGRYTSTEWCEFDGHDGPDQLLEVRLELEVAGSNLCFRYSGAPQIEAFVNAGKGAMWGQVATALLTTLAYGDLRVNGGFWRPIEIDLGEPGTLVHATPPSPVSNGHVEAGMRACKLARDALSQALALSHDPELRGRVAGKAHDGPPVMGLLGKNQHGGESLVFYLDPASGIGGGAQSVADGQDAYGCTCMTGCGLSDLEVHEAADPLLFLSRRVVPNSGGPGLFRGGQGVEQVFALHSVDRMAGPTFLPCAEVPASGFGGGFPGGAGHTDVLRDTNVLAELAVGHLPTLAKLCGRSERLRNKVGHLALERGDVLVMTGGGGGGLGDPLLRRPERVAADLADGFITAPHAEAAYGVVVGPGRTVDPLKTAECRHAILAARLGRTPRKGLREPGSPGVAVVHRDRAWSCASCAEPLGSGGDNWRTAAATLETAVADRYAQLHMFVRTRSEDPAVVMQEHYCPACGLALGVDVSTRGQALPGAPRLRHAEEGPA